MSARYNQVLDEYRRVVLLVEFITVGRDVTDYALVLMVRRGERLKTVRVYDGTHGVNEIHRYTRSGGKQKAAQFHAGTLGEGMRMAIDEIKCSYSQMIEGWDR